MTAPHNEDRIVLALERLADAAQSLVRAFETPPQMPPADDLEESLSGPGHIVYHGDTTQDSPYHISRRSGSGQELPQDGRDHNVV